jgi:hypothetical protein
MREACSQRGAVLRRFGASPGQLQRAALDELALACQENEM